MSIFDRFRSGRELEDEIIRLRREIRALERAGKKPAAVGSLLEVARALRDARSLDAFADAALAGILEVSGGSVGALVLENEAGELGAVAARSPTGPVDPSTIALSTGIAAEAARGLRPVATGSAAEDSRFRAFQSVQMKSIGSVLCLPLRLRSSAHGCIYLTGGEQGLRRADPEELLALADLVSIGLDRLAADAEISRRERLEAVGLSAASIAHDLKLPLATAELALEELLAEIPAGQPAGRTVLGALSRAREIAQGLASFARGTESKLDLAPLPVAALLEEHAAEIGPLAAASRVSIETGLGWSGSLLANRSAVLRVLGNIGKNAVEAMPQGGKLSYKTASPGEISVSDTGPGIAPEHLARLFRPFETFGKAGGCGLGLALARDLVRAMGGDIKAESAVGKGTTIRVRLGVAP